VVPNCRCGPKKIRRLEPLTLAKCGLSRSSTGIRRQSSCDYPALQSLRIAPPTPAIAREHQMPDGLAVTRSNDQRSKSCQHLNRLAREIPIGREIGRRPVQFRCLRNRRFEKTLRLGGAERIARQQQPVFRTKY
jgi:hypothetical protein